MNLFEKKYQEWRGLLTKEDLSDDKLELLVKAQLHQEKHNQEPTAKLRLRNLVENKINKICNQSETVKTEARGDVDITIEYQDGTIESKTLQNTVLQRGKQALAKALTNEVNDPFDFYAQSMVFGTNGTSSGTPRFVDSSRTGLFGTTLLTKNIISSREDSAPTTSIFTSVITFDEGNGYALNEMGLKLKNGDLYSMITFPDLNKTSTIQLTFNWRVSFL